MTRPGLVVDSSRRPLSWVIVAASFVAYLGLLVAIGMTGLLLDVPLPWWMTQTAPPLLYALLVLVVVRPRSAASLCGGALLLWAVHLLLGMLTEPMLALLDSPGASGMTWSFPPAPFPELLWVPVLLVPLRDRLKGGLVSRSAHLQHAAGRRPVPERRTPPSAAPTPLPAGRTPVTTAVDATGAVGKPLFEKPTMAPPRPLGATTVMSMGTSMESRRVAARRPVVSAPATSAAGLAAPDSDGSGSGSPPAGAAMSAAPETWRRSRRRPSDSPTIVDLQGDFGRAVACLGRASPGPASRRGTCGARRAARGGDRGRSRTCWSRAGWPSRSSAEGWCARPGISWPRRFRPISSR